LHRPGLLLESTKKTHQNLDAREKWDPTKGACKASLPADKALGYNKIGKVLKTKENGVNVTEPQVSQQTTPTNEGSSII